MNASGLIDIFKDAVADGVGTAIKVDEYDKVTLQLGSADDALTNAADLTIRFLVSVSNTAPNFAGTRTVANHFEYVDVIDLQSGTSIDGDTGIRFGASGAANDFRNLEVNFGGAKCVCAVISGYVSGKLTLKAYGVTH